jgi:LysR family transcriptional regulator, glycine cleavage system transcriptional activator
MRIPSLQTLRAFDAAGRHHSYSKAGEELGLTHSAISHRIRELEALTGQRLFERSGNRMLPTADGTRLLAQVRNALSLLESVFGARRGSVTQPRTISVSAGLSRWLVPRLGRFREAHPAVELVIDLSSAVVELGKGTDAAIRYGCGPWPETERRLVCDEIVFPVCSPDYRDTHKISEPRDLLSCTLLRHPWFSWAAWFEAAGVSSEEPGDGPVYSDSSLLIDAAQAGEGVALARGMIVADALQDGALVRPFGISLQDRRSYYFVRPAGVRDAQLDALEAWLISELNEAHAALHA